MQKYCWQAWSWIVVGVCCDMLNWTLAARQPFQLAGLWRNDAIVQDKAWRIMMKDMIDSSHAIQTACITSGIPCPLKTWPSLHFYPLPPKVASHIFSSSLQCLHVDGRPGKTASKKGKQLDVASKRLCQTLGLNSHVAVLLHPCLGRALLMAKLLHKSLQLTNLTIHIPNIPTLTLPVLLKNLRCPTRSILRLWPLRKSSRPGPGSAETVPRASSMPHDWFDWLPLETW